MTLISFDFTFIQRHDWSKSHKTSQYIDVKYYQKVVGLHRPREITTAVSPSSYSTGVTETKVCNKLAKANTLSIKHYADRFNSRWLTESMSQSAISESTISRHRMKRIQINYKVINAGLLCRQERTSRDCIRPNRLPMIHTVVAVRIW